MGKNPYYKYLLLQVLALPVVLLLFRVIPERKLASLFASAVFIGLSLLLFVWEFRARRWQARAFWLTGGIFFVVFVLPIFLLRISHWDQEFSTIALGPIEAKSLHGLSNLSFMIWMGACLYEGWKIKKAP